MPFICVSSCSRGGCRRRGRRRRRSSSCGSECGCARRSSTSALRGSNGSIALLFHHGVPRPPALLTRDGQALLDGLELTASARQTLDVALAMIRSCEQQLAPLDRELQRYARGQAGCVALMSMFGVGPLTSAAILAELGDARRFSSSRHAVRFAGLDVTVYSSDDRRSPGRLSRQGSSVLRWAMYEAAQTAARAGSPDRAYYLSLAARLGKSRAKVALARKLLRRAHHILRELGDAAICPAT
jgi:transposase